MPFTPDHLDAILAVARWTQNLRCDEAIVTLLLDTGIRAAVKEIDLNYS